MYRPKSQYSSNVANGIALNSIAIASRLCRTLLFYICCLGSLNSDEISHGFVFALFAYIFAFYATYSNL